MDVVITPGRGSGQNRFAEDRRHHSWIVMAIPIIAVLTVQGLAGAALSPLPPASSRGSVRSRSAIPEMEIAPGGAQWLKSRSVMSETVRRCAAWRRGERMPAAISPIASARTARLFCVRADEAMMLFTWNEHHDDTVESVTFTTEQKVCGAVASTSRCDSAWNWGLFALSDDGMRPLGPRGATTTNEQAKVEAEQELRGLARAMGRVYAIAENALTEERAPATIRYSDVEDGWLLTPVGFPARSAEKDGAGTFGEWRVIGIVTPVAEDRAAQEILLEMMIGEDVFDGHVISKALTACQ